MRQKDGLVYGVTKYRRSLFQLIDTPQETQNGLYLIESEKGGP